MMIDFQNKIFYIYIRLKYSKGSVFLIHLAVFSLVTHSQKHTYVDF